MLPPENLLAIVNEPVSNCRTLFDLIFVSRHSLALQPLYDEIAFCVDRLDESMINKLCYLAHTESNPGMRFTTTCSFVSKGHRAGPPILFDEIGKAIKRIVHCIYISTASVNAQIPVAAGRRCPTHASPGLRMQLEVRVSPPIP
ncbi:hypothetical protein CCMSSC00406_0005970 [Pleurotus cornucopiae]|uniref:Uncharacterized protein n=1 Tax=Pleurotus cornucopiae TaxID=5321 RepID=A0ACB7IQ14_PLECO|nr:hypothetical protein CCMSSC00406_0005970 [Pleurotus cornucopiae]